VQCVTGAGALSVTGVWISDHYDAASGETTTVSSKIGPAAAEDYDYDMESAEAYGGRAMPVPGWPAGAHRAWEVGGRLRWAELLEPAIALADDGYPLDPRTFTLVRMGPLAARTAEGRELWMRDGRYLEVGDRFRQPALARTLRALADGGPAAFYEGAFAQEYVRVARERGGKLTLADMAGWRERPEVRPAALSGDYCGFQVVTEGALLVYALHLCQAAGVGELDEPGAVYAQVRVLEEIFHATREYSPTTHDQFVDPGYAESKIDAVLSAPLRPTSFAQFWSNTATLAVRDGDGNVAWLVHSLNTPNVFGTGIVVGGAYAVRAISRTHARVGDLLAPGLFSKVALFRDGQPYAIAASPGYACVHGSLQALVAHVQRQLDPPAANAAPRFALPNAATVNLQPFESHYSPAVFELLAQRGVPYMECSPSLGTVAMLVVDGDTVHAVSDGRSGAGAVAFAPETRNVT
jgi:gamma-glutamyltranspeptidase